MDRYPTWRVKVNCVFIIFFLFFFCLCNITEFVVVSVVIKIRQNASSERITQFVSCNTNTFRTLPSHFLTNLDSGFQVIIIPMWSLEALVTRCFTSSCCVPVVFRLLRPEFCETKNILMRHARLLRYENLVLSSCVVLLLFIFNIVYSSL